VQDFYQQVYHLVAQIPSGRVMTYGQIAIILGCPTAARAGGYALRQSPPGSNLPWQRVINAQGKISPRGPGDLLHEPILQRVLLEAEGIQFDAHGKLDLARYRWEPDAHHSRADLDLDTFTAEPDEDEKKY
jgi:methylated-DNA-protein-cysteine methyltransferase related protein